MFDRMRPYQCVAGWPLLVLKIYKRSIVELISKRVRHTTIVELKSER